MPLGRIVSLYTVFMALSSVQWNSRPHNYVSVTTHGFPNKFMFLGHNFSLGSGNLFVLVTKMTEYTAQVLEKMRRENILTVQPSAAFTASSQKKVYNAYFADTEFSEHHSSRGKERVTDCLPGG